MSAFGSIAEGTTLNDVTVSVAGRVMAMRSSSAKLQFYDLHGEGKKIQIMYNLAGAADEKQYEFIRDNVRRGDIIGVTGHPGKTKKGELSIMPTAIEILTPCLHMMPKGFYGLSDKETRYRCGAMPLLMVAVVPCWDRSARHSSLAAVSTPCTARRHTTSQAVMSDLLLLLTTTMSSRPR